jgi:hypothetical protein
MISYRIGFSECEHGRASNGQHARNRLFNESFPACQVFFQPRGGNRLHPLMLKGLADEISAPRLRIFTYQWLLTMNFQLFFTVSSAPPTDSAQFWRPASAGGSSFGRSLKFGAIFQSAAERTGKTL